MSHIEPVEPDFIDALEFGSQSRWFDDLVILDSAAFRYSTRVFRLSISRTMAFWLSNVFDEEYKVDVFDITRDSNTILEVWGKTGM
jgi:hypothetical protein